MSRGFTLLELAVVTSLVSLAVPSVYLFGRSVEARHQESLARLEASAAMRTLSGELNRDLYALDWEGPSGTVLVNDGGGCQKVEYSVSPEGAVMRTAAKECGGVRAIARGVASMTRDASGLLVTFTRRTGRAAPFVTTFRMGP